MSQTAANNSDELVLVLAPTGRDAQLALSALQRAGFNARVCKDAAQLGKHILEGAGAALVAEEALNKMDIGEIKQTLTQQPPWSDFPFVVFTSMSDLAVERRIVDDMLGILGNVTLVERPVRIQTMLSAITAVLRARRRQYQVRDLLREVKTLNGDLERRVEERTAALQEITRQMEAFAYSISHDLRAPLRSIHSFSEILVNHHADKLDAEALDYLNRILKSAKYMDSLTQDLLAYSRLSRAEFPVQKVSLDDCIATVLYQMAEEIRVKKAEIAVERPLPDVLAHVAPLEQILSNLLSNALKFTRPNVPIHIRIHAQPRKSKVRIWVEDNGIGIAPEYHERIFRLFERLAPVNVYPGTGMGLAIAKKAAERMGGNVGVESQPNCGSRFWFELPVIVTQEGSSSPASTLSGDAVLTAA